MNNRDYDSLLSAGNRAQLEKLQKNNHKEGFDSFDNIGKLFFLLRNEMVELSQECVRLSPVDYQKARQEAADVANYAHMIILLCDRKIG